MDILFPPGRMVGGNIDKLFPRTEANGTPKIGKDGNPEMQCSIGYAIPKNPGEQVWYQTTWGAEIYKIGQAAHPNLVASPSFSWKITDGDSTLPNKKGKRPCDQAGYPGHWVIWFSQGWLPKRVNADGSIELPEGSIVAGYYVQMFGSCNGNKLVPNGTPGVYLNPIAVALVGEGDKIATDVDTTSVGFGTAPLPAGARPVTPVAPQFAPPPMPGAPAPGAVAPPVLPVTPIAPVAPVGYPVGGVQPAPNYMMPPPMPGAPAPVAPPVMPVAPVAAVAPVPQMTATAQAAGYTYEVLKNAGWTDDQMRAAGHII